MNDEQIVCNCMQITKQEIYKAIIQGYNTIDSIGGETEAGTVCGNCQEDISSIIEQHVC